MSQDVCGSRYPDSAAFCSPIQNQTPTWPQLDQATDGLFQRKAGRRAQAERSYSCNLWIFGIWSWTTVEQLRGHTSTPSHIWFRWLFSFNHFQRIFLWLPKEVSNCSTDFRHFSKCQRRWAVLQGRTATCQFPVAGGFTLGFTLGFAVSHGFHQI